MADWSPQGPSDKMWQTWLRCRMRLLFLGPDREAAAPGIFSNYEAGKKQRYELFFAVTLYPTCQPRLRLRHCDSL